VPSYLGVKNQIFMIGKSEVLTELERVFTAVNFIVSGHPKDRRPYRAQATHPPDWESQLSWSM